MTLRCNNCGAPVPAPTEDAVYAACPYCGTAVALPARPPRLSIPSPPVSVTPVSLRGHLGLLALPVGIALVGGGIALVAVVAKNVANGSTPIEKTSELTKPTEVVLGPNIEPSEERPTQFGTSTRTETGAKPENEPSRPGQGDVRRGVKGGAATPKPSASVAPAPSSPPEPPPVPKVARASIGSITVKRGSYPPAEIKSRLGSITGLVRNCYAEHLREKPDESGTLDMSFSISGGMVRGAGARNPLFSGNVVSCVNRAFNTMSFSNDGDVTEVSCVVTLSKTP